MLLIRYIVQVENFIIGVGEYHDPDILRIKAGLLLNSTLYTFKTNWEQFLAEGSVETKKFIAYSTVGSLLIF